MPTEHAPEAADAPVADKFRWGPVAATVVAVGLYFLQFFTSLLLAIYPLVKHFDKAQTDQWYGSITVQFVFLLVTEALTIEILFKLIWQRGGSLKQIGFTKPRLLQDIGWAIIGTVGYFLVYATVFSFLAAHVPQVNTNQQQDVGFANPHGLVQLILTFISLVILPPIAEETIFRGYLFSAWRTRFSVFWSGLAVSLLFASAHLPEGVGGGPLWIGAVDTFTLSCFLVLARVKTGRLYSSMLIHAMKNGAAFLALFVLHVK